MPVSGSTANVPAKIEKDTFFNMSIADAAAKFLMMSNRKPQPTNAIIEAMEKGGLKRSAYQTVYSILSRRQNQRGDVVNVNGDWALQEWYGTVKPKPKKKAAEEVPAGADAAEIAADEIGADQKLRNPPGLSFSFPPARPGCIAGDLAFSLLG